MRKILASLLTLVGFGAQAVAPAEKQSNAEASQGLREMVFGLFAKDIGIDQSSFRHEVWGVVMETGMDGGAYTVVVLADGTTSMYFSSGGGVIGAGEHESVRAVSGNFLGWANKYVGESSPAKSHSLPAPGITNFYFLTFHGLKTYSAKEDDLGEGRDKLSELFHAGHAVIAEVRQSSGE